MELKNPIETTYRYEFGIYRFEKARKEILERDRKVQEAIPKKILENKKIDDEIIQEIRRTTDDLLNLIDRITGQVCSPEEFKHLRNAAIVANGHLSILINENFSKYVDTYNSISENLGFVSRWNIIVDNYVPFAAYFLALLVLIILYVYFLFKNHDACIIFGVLALILIILPFLFRRKVNTNLAIDRSYREINKHLYYVKKEYVPVSDSFLKIIKNIRK